MLSGLSLFSGIGGIDVALSEWVRPIAYCEIDLYCQGILLSRMGFSEIASAPIWNDILTFSGTDLRGAVDIIYGGFPCQNLSVAGLREGLEGKQSGLFYEILRLCRETQCGWVFLENVPGLVSLGGTEVVRELTALGYDCRWCVISAASLGAPHKRDRWFLLAHFQSGTHREHNDGPLEGQKSEFGASFSGETVPSNTQNSRSRQSDSREQRQSGSGLSHSKSYWEETECPLCGVDDGVSHRLDRIRALGNSVVIPQAKEAFKILMGIK